MLDHFRVLDLTDERGHSAGFFLAQLGAEVVAVEPPEGQRSRHLGPFVGDEPHLDRSISHWAYNRGKQSVVVDFDRPESAEVLDTLAATADVVVECGAVPVDLARLRRRHPRLVTVSISPFGGDGPKAGWAATDLTLVAASGQMSITGDRDRPPVRISVPQTAVHAGSEAACAALVALAERHRSGLGQHVDVSAQEATMLAAQGWMAPALSGAPAVRRLAGGAELLGQLRFRFVYGCADGHITITFLPGVMVGPYTGRLMRWVHEEGHAEADLASLDWATLLSDLPLDEIGPLVERASDAVARCVATRTKAELFALAREREFLLMPVATPSDVVANEHFAHCGFWDDVEVSGRPVRFPGPYARTGAAPMARPHRPPTLGEHTDAVLTAGRAVDPGSAAHIGGPAGGGERRPPLEGLKVVDLTWVYAGPFATRMLAYYGATVVRVESSVRPDQVRSAGIARAGDGGPEDSLQWHSINADKLSLQLNLSVPAAREVLSDLARWADVLVDAFAPGVMDRFGLGPEAAAALNPQLITMSTSLFGHEGPLSSIPGFGNMGAASAGFYHLTGWPDRLPAGPFLAYTDATSPKLMVALILAALEWRRRSGEGTHLDFSQAAGGVHFLTPAVLEAQLCGRDLCRMGNADPLFAPHGVFGVGAPDADRWIAIACETDEQWAALAHLMDRPDLALLDRSARHGAAGELDAAISAWTAGRDPLELEQCLQYAGIPAHTVQNSPECVADPQLRHRDHFAEVPHPTYGHSWAEQYGFRLSTTPGRPRRAGPTWGEHNDLVLTGLLGYDDERIAELAIAGALE